MAAPYRPTARQLAWFWLAGPLTCAIFTPILLSGLFGAPNMIFVGVPVAWWLLRGGRDSYGQFAVAGVAAALATLPLYLVGDAVLGLEQTHRFGVMATLGKALVIALFGLIFGPLMAMTFRTIAGSWRPDPAP